MWPVHTDMMSLSLEGGGGEQGSLKLKRCNLVMRDAFLKFSIWSLSYSRVFFFLFLSFFLGGGWGVVLRAHDDNAMTEHLFCRAQLSALLLSLCRMESTWI